MRVPFLAALLALSCAHGRDRDPPPETSKRDPNGTIRLLLHHPGDRAAPTDTCDVELCSSLAQMLTKAETSVDFAIYGMRNQTDVLTALTDAKARGVRVRGVVDRDHEGKNYYTSTDKLVEALGRVASDREADMKLARREAREGWGGEPACARPAGTAGPVQCLAYDLGDSCLLAAHASREELAGGDAIMHDKFFVVDERFVWTGSTNVSDSCSGGYNANLVAVIDSPELARRYTEEFEQMHTKGQYHQLKRSRGRLKVQLADAEVELLFSPQDSPIRTGVRPLIKQAKQRIDIAVFFLTHKHITEDLIEAHQRGVKVRVVLDATAARNEYTKHELLRAAGIPVKVENWGGKMHMKATAIDGEVVIAGSMNWTSSGEFSNDENTLLVHSTTHAAQFHAFFDELWSSLPEALLTANPDPESLASSTACSDGVDNDYDGQRDAEDPGCSANPPPLPATLPWKIVPKAGRMTCDVGMDGDAPIESDAKAPPTAVPTTSSERISAD